LNLEQLKKPVQKFQNSSGVDSLLLCDKFAVWILILFGLVLLFGGLNNTVYFNQALYHFLFAALIWWLASRKPYNIIFEAVRFHYPVILIAIIHYDVGYFIPMIYGDNTTFDSVVRQWEFALFSTHPHLHLHEMITQSFWVEVIHFFYLTYYPILIGSLTWIWLKRTDDFPRFAFVYIGMFFSFVIFFILFPVIGPLDYRVGLFEDKSVLANLVDLLFLIGAPDGAAFPSSHVGLSVGVLMLLRPMSRTVFIVLSICILGIGFSMIYASIHYAIDAFAGLIAGFLLFHTWNFVYRKIE
jgi:membrane-associated phospholipid phosphatase